eukprot:GFYU01033814.1.p1 GENE.GFYU01033814.1~~GFYU01033814.1.p1  ORF type:complete len:112 (+),score=22.70 GFYU01033814.1:19-354(+)
MGIEPLLLSGADVNHATLYGHTSLWLAAKGDHTDVISLLLQASADVNTTRAEEGATPLWIACHHGNVGAVKILLAAGAVPTIADTETGKLPRQVAEDGGHADVVRALDEIS